MAASIDATRVTRENFDGALELMERALDGCLFVSFDLEMTGIGPWMRTPGDTPNERYCRMAEVAQKYAIIQLGITVFSESEGGIVGKPFNFFSFPSGKTRDVQLNSDAADFLSRNRMDFQTWITQGIGFVDAPTEAKLRKQMTASIGQDRSRNTVCVTKPDDVQFVQQAVAEFKWWLGEQRRQGDPPGEHGFPACNSWLRRALYQEIDSISKADAIAGELIREVRSNPDTPGRDRIFVMRLTEEDKTAREARLKAEAQKKLDNRVGLRRVFKMLVDAKKPLVGHNMMYDLLFLLNSYDRPLPPTVNEFKTRVHELFPVVFDTKLLANTGSAFPRQTPGTQYADTALGPLYDKLKTDGKLSGVSISSEAPYNRYHDPGEETPHEAGWDSLMTGAIFVVLVESYVIDASGTVAGPGSAGIDAVSSCGRSNLLNGTATLIRWNIVGSDMTQAILEEGNTYLVSELKKEHTDQNVIELFEISGDSRAEVKWIDDGSAFVSIFPDVTSAGKVGDVPPLHAANAAKASVTVEPWGKFAEQECTTEPDVNVAQSGGLFASVLNMFWPAPAASARPAKRRRMD